MNYRALGNTGLQVSEIGLGCEGFAEDNCNEAKKLLDEAEKLGINYFDLYASDPAVRSALGTALQGRRNKFFLQAHLCSVWKNGQYERTRKIDEVKQSFADLLKRLATDHIDVGMIHYCDSMSDWQEIANGPVLSYALEQKKLGHIHHIGLSSHNPEVALAAVQSGSIEVLMFSVNPCYDLQPPSETVEDLWADEAYSHKLVNMDPQRQR